MPQTLLHNYFKPPVIVSPLFSDVRAEGGEVELPPPTAYSLHNPVSSSVTDNPGSDTSEASSGPSLLPELEKDHASGIPEIRTSPNFSEIAILPVQRSHLPAIQRLTSTLLPVRYPDKFFSGTVDEIVPAVFSRVALSMSQPVGWVRCRLDPFPEQTSPPSNARPIYHQVYVQALCLLAPYRGRGVATALLESVLQPRLLLEYGVASVYAHVWECNADALEWYRKRGFYQVAMVENYYRRLRPGGAWIVRRDLR